MSSKNKLKSYSEFVEAQNSHGRQMANLSMGSNYDQLGNKAKDAHINDNKYRNTMKRWLAEIEQRLGLSNSQDENFHQQAFEMLENLLKQAVTGKKQWALRQQVNNFKSNFNKQSNPYQNPVNPQIPNQLPQNDFGR